MQPDAENLTVPVNMRAVRQYSGRGVFVDDGGIGGFAQFFAHLAATIEKTEAKFEDDVLTLKDGLSGLRELYQRARYDRPENAKLIMIGNGGSSAIASHMATDYSKNGGVRTIAFNDAPTLTCLANDFGGEEIFAKQLEYYALPGDIVTIISSSGKSPNILRAAEKTVEMGLDLVTFSGMNPDNRLRRSGMRNFFSPAIDYGLVELAHLALLHSIISVPRKA